MSISSDVAAIFTNHLTQAQNMTNQAAAGVQAAFAAFASIEPYTAYEWQSGSPPVIGYNPTFPTPGKPALGALQGNPALAPYPAVGTIAKGSVPSLTATKPSFTYPTAPSGEPSDSTGTVPRMSTLSIPPKPNMYPLPAATLPYTTLNLPPHPVWTDPIFNAKPPEDITSITLEEYLAMLTQAFAEYADTIPRLVQGHWLEWYRAMLGENPLIKKIEGILSATTTRAARASRCPSRKPSSRGPRTGPRPSISGRKHWCSRAPPGAGCTCRPARCWPGSRKRGRPRPKPWPR
jgi:hypothetical protein